jgi:hypothetical protein
MSLKHNKLAIHDSISSVRNGQQIMNLIMWRYFKHPSRLDNVGADGHWSACQLLQRLLMWHTLCGEVMK